MDKNILTVKDVAKYLDICAMTVYRYAKQGKLPAFKIGSDWRFRRNSINRWIRSKEKWHIKQKQKGEKISKLRSKLNFERGKPTSVS